MADKVDIPSIEIGLLNQQIKVQHGILLFKLADLERDLPNSTPPSADWDYEFLTFAGERGFLQFESVV
jgi:hypothetical protein